jgi:hypothetical protein
MQACSSVRVVVAVSIIIIFGAIERAQQAVALRFYLLNQWMDARV